MRKKNIFKYTNGFNLIELMIVVVVIGILSAIAIPKFQQAIEEAKLKEAQAVLKAIRNAEKVFKAERGSYVGVDIDGSAANKTNWWTMLRIQEVADDADWDYGVDVLPPCGCNAGSAGWGEDPDNQKCVPYARRKRGPNFDAGRIWMHIQMLDGFFPMTMSGNFLRNQQCSGGVVDCSKQ